MMVNNVSFNLISREFIDKKTGQPSEVGQRFLLSLFTRTGGGSPPGNTDIYSAIEELEGQFLASFGQYQPSAYTQTYSATSRVNNNVTSLAVAGTPTSAGWGLASSAEVTALLTSINAIRTDIDNIKQVLNSLIDDIEGISKI